MKILSWNVNGLRAALRKGALIWAWNQKPDALCLQEIRTRPDQLTDEQRAFSGYHAIWNPAEKAGYSGVATFLRSPAIKSKSGLGRRRFDVEGRVISTLHPDFRLLNVYVPSGTRGRERVDFKLDFYSHLLKVCDRLHNNGEALILTGDFNTARTPMDLKNPKSNQKTSGFMPEERAWVQKFLDHGLIDIYRHLYPERVQYTWWTNILNARQRGVGWRIDYFLISESLTPRVKDAIIHDGIPGSDHCPIELILN